MTVLEFLAAAAGTQIVTPGFTKQFPPLLILLLIQTYQFGWRAILPQQAHHQLHGLIDMMKECLVTGAQIVQAGLTIRGVDEAIFRTAAMTRDAHIAVQTILRQRVEFVAPELQLLIRRDQFNHVSLIGVAQLVLRLDEVIARIQIAVVLQR